VGGYGGGDLSGHLGGSPCRLFLRQRSDRIATGFEQDRAVDLVGCHPADGLIHDLVGVEAECFDLAAPTVMKCGGVDVVGFGWAGVDDGFAFETPPFAWCRVAVEGVDEPVQLLIDAALHPGGAGRELLEHRVVHAGDFGDAVHHRLPIDPEAGGQLRAQGQMVDA